jgi:hypothetical protein
MSARRNIGEHVTTLPNVGFLCSGGKHSAIIPDTPENQECAKAIDDWFVCTLGCGDPKCREWPTLWAWREPNHAPGDEPDLALCHVSECQMEEP